LAALSSATTACLLRVGASTDPMRPTSRSGRRTLQRLALDWSTVERIATGHADHATGTALLAAERSHRAVLLRTVLDLARAAGTRATGPLEGVDTAWDLLVDAQRVDSWQTDAVLSRPETGSWAAHLLRRLRSSGPDDPERWTEPLWVDVGYLHAIAVAAAARAGVEARLSVPARRGAVTVPSVGWARGLFSDVWEPVVVDTIENAVRVRANGWLVGPGYTSPLARGAMDATWQSSISIHVGPDTARLAVDLDHTSPYRMLVGTTMPDQLSDGAVPRWKRLLHDAWSILRETDAQQADALALATSTIVPLPSTESPGVLSASTGDAFGKVLLSEPGDAEQLAASLVHEFHHAQLGVLMHLTDVVTPDATHEQNLFYSPWRDDPRPLRGFMQGTFAFFGVAGFWLRRLRMAQTEGSVTTASFEFSLWRRRVHSALHRLCPRPELTAVGARFFECVTTTLDTWMSEPVPPDIEDLARLAITDHHGRWRIHHLVPPRTAVSDLAEAWCQQAALPPLDQAAARASVVTDPAARHLDAMAFASRQWLACRGALDGAIRPPSARVSGAQEGDLLLVAGRHDDALAAYLGEFTTGSVRAGAWTGLGRALAAAGDAAAARALLTRPELVRAVAEAVTTTGGERPAPVDLAAWIGLGLDAEDT